ncbi:MAG TPA: hypothetical protein VFW96_29610 [Thermomicrobiales bacterium]|nr:hypothetical protein [Thermomicrobiales bacterium]
MATPPDPAGRLTVFAATGLEAWAARRALPRDVAVVRVGVGLRAWARPAPGPFVSCGLAGALTPEIAPGAVLIPEWVGLPTGERFRCDPPLVAALVAAARALGREPVTAPLVTTPRLVTGPARRAWAARGFAGADMESGLLLAWHPRGAVARVVLDAPGRDLAPAWARPARIALAPWLWPQALRIAAVAPAYALRAAAVVRAAVPDYGLQIADCRSKIADS